MPDMNLNSLIKHLIRTMAQYFKKPSWEENRVQIESLMKTLFNFLVQSYF